MTNLTFKWDPPQGSGPENIVDNYTIIIHPEPILTSSINIIVSLLSWNVTLAHNEMYSINITAVNCAGSGETFVFPSIEYSKLRVHLTFTQHIDLVA